MFGLSGNLSHECTIMASNKPSNTNIPSVVRFAFYDFKINLKETTWSAKCTICKETYHDTKGTSFYA